MISGLTSTKTRFKDEVRSYPNSLFAVFSWELRRRFVGPSFWIIAFLVFVFTLTFMWLGQYKACVERYDGSCIALAGTSAYGIMLEMPGVLLLWFAMLLPFLSADLVTLDLKRRTHEFLMTTPLSKWSYIWGRYLAGLVLCLFLALLMLLGILLMGFALRHFLWLGLDGPSDLVGYPDPNVGAIATIWAIIVLPTVFLVSGISFFFSTLIPRASGLVKAFVIIGWVICFTQFSPLLAAITRGYLDPSGNAISYTFDSMYLRDYFTHVTHTMTLDQRQHVLDLVQQKMPDLTPWIVAHTAYAVLGLMLVALTALLFRRFDTTLVLRQTPPKEK